MRNPSQMAATDEAAHTSSQQLKPGATQQTKRPSTSNALSFFLDRSALVDFRRTPKYPQFEKKEIENMAPGTELNRR
jgi:hypothetical protein